MAIESLVAALDDADSDTREAAAIALGRQGDPRVSDALANCLNDTEPGVRVCAAVALAKLGWSPATSEQRSGFVLAFDELQAAATAGEDAVRPIFEELAHAIGLEGQPHPEAFEPAEVAGNNFVLETPTATLQAEPAEANGDSFEEFAGFVQSCEPPAELPPEIPFETADDEMDGTEAAGVANLIAALEDPDATTRVSAIEELNQAQGEEVTAAVLNCLSDPDPTVRLAAARSIENWGDPAHVPHFLALLADEHWELRMLAIRFVSRMNDPQGAATLCPLLADTNLHVRRAAAQALGVTRNPAAIEDLVVTLVDEEATVRTAATTALEQINPYWAASAEAQRAQPRLQALLTDNRPRTSASAAQLLIHLRASAVSV